MRRCMRGCNGARPEVIYSAIMSLQDIREALPNLNVSDFVIESEPTPSYNCVAWVFGDMASRWDPAQIFGYYWPHRISRSLSVDNFIGMFELIGQFVKCENGELEMGIEKIAVYEDVDGDFSHVARQRPDGSWTSKVGSLDDIGHVSPTLLEKDYGRIVQFLKRSIQNVKTDEG